MNSTVSPGISFKGQLLLPSESSEQLSQNGLTPERVGRIKRYVSRKLEKQDVVEISSNKPGQLDLTYNNAKSGKTLTEQFSLMHSNWFTALKQFFLQYEKH